MSRITSVRIILAIAALRSLEVHQMDVKTAFLNGDLEEEIYMEQPEGCVVPEQERKVYRLVKSLYGLKQAPREWYHKFDAFMKSQKFWRSDIDHCLYTKKDSSGNLLTLMIYVDDMLITRKNSHEVANLKQT